MDSQEIIKRDAEKYMPITNVTKIMRRVLPPHAKIADDAKETIQECVSEFIGFITTEAKEKCHREYRKTITPEDVLVGMKTLGFDNYVGPLGVYLDEIRNKDIELCSAQPLQTVKRRASLVQFEHGLTESTQRTGYVPRSNTYVANRNSYVGSSQINNFYVHDAGGHGGGSSSNLEFNPFMQFK